MFNKYLSKQRISFHGPQGGGFYRVGSWKPGDLGVLTEPQCRVLGMPLLLPVARVRSLCSGDGCCLDNMHIGSCVRCRKVGGLVRAVVNLA